MRAFSREYLLGPVNTKNGWLLLLGCCFVNGLVDSSIFNNYGVFAAMQTGNTIILCLNTARLPSGNTYAYAKTLVVLVSFFTGAVLTSHCWNLLPGGPLRRINMTANFAIQAALIFISAALIQSDTIPQDDAGGASLLNNAKVIGVLVPLALQGGATIASSRLLGFAQEIPVNVLTSTYAALAADTKLLKRHNPPRDRRVLAILCTIIGALIGAWMMRKTTEGINACLWMAAGIKTILSISVFFGLEPKEAMVDEPKIEAGNVRSKV